MRVELATSTAGLGAGRPSVAAVMPRRRRIDPFELGLLAVFAIVSVWVLGLDLWQVIVNGRDWTGTDGVYLVDQMQYLAWIRDASHHLLASNLFVLRTSRRLLPAGDRGLGRPVGDRRADMALVAVVEAGRRARLLLRRARVRAPQPDRPVAAPRRADPGAVLRVIHGHLRVGQRDRRHVPRLPFLGLCVRS